MNIAIIGDYNPNYPPHPATTQSLGHASSFLMIEVNITWIPTESLKNDIAGSLAIFHAVWLGPAPYQNKQGVINAVKIIRESNLPFLGTCGGLYQSMVEFGINVLKLNDELFEKRSLEPGDDFFMMDSSCGSHGFKVVQFSTVENTRTRKFYNSRNCEEDSNCGFCINPLYFKQLENNEMKISGLDDRNEAKVFEFLPNDFFILTKFLPQMRSEINKPHPLIKAFINAGMNNQSVLKLNPKNADLC